jgi:peptide/nickel transport system substrate-binding protein
MEPIVQRGMTRRTVLKLSLGGVAASLLAACSPGPPPAPAKPADSAKPAATTAPKPTEPVAAAIKPGAGATAAPAAAPTAAPAAKVEKPTAQVRRGGKLVVGQVGDNNAFEPFVQQPTTFPFLEQLFNAPIRYDNEIKPHPSLAESWQLSQDGKSVTIKLRQGVKFSAGREVTAEDVNFSVDRAKDPKVGALFRPQAVLVTRTEAPDKYTAVWGFDSPFPGAFDLLARQWVVDKENVNENDWKKKAVGTGPFTWTEWQPGERSLMKKNPGYWEKGADGQPLPYLDEIEVRSFGDANAMAANLEAGSIDIVSRLPTQEVARLKQNSSIKVFQAPVRVMYDVLLQSVKPPFNNKELRQAINWAIDRERFARTVLAGLGVASSQPFPSHSWGHFPELDKTYTFNLDKAKEMLVKAGYPDGLDVTLMTATARQKELAQLAQIIASDLAKINVRVKIEDVEPAVYDPRHLAGEFEMATHAYGRANLDPSTLFRGAAAWHAGTGMTKFDTPEYRRLMEDAESSYDQNERKPKYKKLVEYIQDESFVCPVATNPEFYVMRSRVQGFTSDGEANMSMRETWLEG